MGSYIWLLYVQGVFRGDSMYRIIGVVVVLSLYFHDKSTHFTEGAKLCFSATQPTISPKNIQTPFNLPIMSGRFVFREKEH